MGFPFESIDVFPKEAWDRSWIEVSDIISFQGAIRAALASVKLIWETIYKYDAAVNIFLASSLDLRIVWDTQRTQIRQQTLDGHVMSLSGR